MSRDLLVAILTRNRSEALNHLLTSKSENLCLKECPILVLDGSPGSKQRLLNKHIIDQRKLLANIKYVDKQIWKNIQLELIKKISEQKLHDVFCKIQVGGAGFNTPAGRNALMILAAWYFPHITQILFLDDDMVVPADFSVKMDNLQGITDLSMAGCPDFSRTQWMQYYLLYLAKKYLVKVKLRKYHPVDSTVVALSVKTSANLLARYTDLWVEKKYLSGIGKEFVFRKFEIGSFFCESKLLRLTLFPNCYTEQMVWKQAIHKFHKIDFGNKIFGHLVHAACRKEILKSNQINREIFGIILGRLIISKPTSKCLDDKILFLTKDMNNRISNGADIANKLLKHGLSIREERQVREILVCLSSLTKFSVKNYIDLFRGAYAEYFIDAKQWRRLFKYL